jgi:hypothetical protein
MLAPSGTGPQKREDIMAPLVRSLLRLTPRVLLLSALTTLARPTAAPATTSPSSVDAVATSYYPEVRLRKLHLVRPDLIQYPISYEVYC